MIALHKLYQLFSYCFQQFHQTKFVGFCLAVFLSAFFSYWIMLFLRRSHVRLSITRFLFVSADKSDSNALQTGGLPFSVISIFSIGMLFYWFPYLVNEAQATILRYALASWIGFFVYGQLDDRYEIRPVAKLAGQVFLTAIFCLGAANVMFPMYSAYAFLIMVPIATAVLNGTNLIDGLDTLSYKTSSLIYLSYVLLAANIISLPALFVAVSCFLIMTAFYFFNRYPARIHLGEVGVSCLGFSYIVLATLTFEGYRQFNPPIYAFTKATLPVILVLVEVGVSFIRRALNGRSPFRGDKLHVHHILHGIHGFSPSVSSSIIAGLYALFLSAAFYVMDIGSSVAAFILLSLLSTSWTLAIGWRHWFRGPLKLELFGALLVQEKVKIIPADSLADFRIVILENEKKK